LVVVGRVGRYCMREKVSEEINVKGDGLKR